MGKRIGVRHDFPQKYFKQNRATIKNLCLCRIGFLITTLWIGNKPIGGSEQPTSRPKVLFIGPMGPRGTRMLSELLNMFKYYLIVASFTFNTECTYYCFKSQSVIFPNENTHPGEEWTNVLPITFRIVAVTLISNSFNCFVQWFPSFLTLKHPIKKIYT